MSWTVRAALVAAAVLVTLPASAADKVRMGVAAIYPPFAVPFAARELGFYKEKDLDVEITMYRGGGPTQEALAAGAADVITNSPPGAALAIKKGVKQKIVALGSTPTPHGWYIAVGKDSKITSLSQLDGKTIGVTAKGSSTDFFAQWAGAQGKAKVRSVPLGGAGLLPALKDSQIDAAVLFPPVSFRVAADGSAKLLVDLGKAMEPVLPDTWVATDAMINDRPDVLRRWLEANGKAIAHMQANKDWTIAFLAKWLDEKDPGVLNRSFEEMIKPLDPELKFQPEWVANSIKLAKLAGIDDVPEAKDIFVSRFVPVKYR